MDGHPRAENRGEAGLLFLNRPDKNVLNSEFFYSLKQRLDEFLANPQVKYIVITTSGYVFSTGFDVKQINVLAESNDRDLAKKEISQLHDVLLALERSPKPTIAAINGICLGGGLELALACQYRIGLDRSGLAGLAYRNVILRTMAHLPNPIGLPEIELGLIPGLGGTQRLPRLVGVKNAMRILLSGKNGIAFADALEIGLLDKTVGGENDLVSGTKSFAAEVLANPITRVLPEDHELDLSDFRDHVLYQLANGRSTSAVNALVAAVREGMDRPLEQALKEVELNQFLNCAFSADGREGLAAFFAKRPPKFQQVIDINYPRQ